MTDDALEQLAAAFLSRSLPHEQWTHAAHLCVGAWHVHHFGLDAAIARLRTGIRALNDRHGTPNTTTGGYHDTITIAYARLIDEFLASFASSIPLAQRVSQMLAGPLAERSLLRRFWSGPLLMSEAARAAWIEPDLAPLTLGIRSTRIPGAEAGRR